MRFLLFAGYTFYPSGGIDDLVGMFSTKEEAEEFYLKTKEQKRFDWYHVFDTHTMKLV